MEMNFGMDLAMAEMDINMDVKIDIHLDSYSGGGC